MPTKETLYIPYGLARETFSRPSANIEEELKALREDLEALEEEVVHSPHDRSLKSTLAGLKKRYRESNAISDIQPLALAKTTWIADTKRFGCRRITKRVTGYIVDPWDASEFVNITCHGPDRNQHPNLTSERFAKVQVLDFNDNIDLLYRCGITMDESILCLKIPEPTSDSKNLEPLEELGRRWLDTREKLAPHYAKTAADWLRKAVNARDAATLQEKPVLPYWWELYVELCYVKDIAERIKAGRRDLSTAPEDLNFEIREILSEKLTPHLYRNGTDKADACGESKPVWSVLVGNLDGMISRRRDKAWGTPRSKPPRNEFKRLLETISGDRPIDTLQFHAAIAINDASAPSKTYEQCRDRYYKQKQKYAESNYYLAEQFLSTTDRESERKKELRCLLKSIDHMMYSIDDIVLPKEQTVLAGIYKTMRKEPGHHCVSIHDAEIIDRFLSNPPKTSRRYIDQSAVPYALDQHMHAAASAEVRKKAATRMISDVPIAEGPLGSEFLANENDCTIDEHERDKRRKVITGKIRKQNNRIDPK